MYPWPGPYWPPCHHRGGYMCGASSHQSMSRPSTVHSCGPVHCTSGVYLWHGTVGRARNRFVSFILQSKHHRQQNRRDEKLQMILFVISAPSHFALYSFFCFRNYTENVCWLWLSYRKLKYVLFSKVKKFKHKVKMWNSKVEFCALMSKNFWFSVFWIKNIYNLSINYFFQILMRKNELKI